VDQLARELAGATTFKSLLTVMQIASNKDKFVIIDGNHRFAAVKKLPADQTFETLPCIVHRCMREQEALALAFQCNKQAEDVMKMTDYEITKLVRNIIGEGDSFEEIYKKLNVNTVRIKMRLTHCKQLRSSFSF